MKSNTKTVQSGLLSMRKNGRQLIKIQKVPPLTLHQRNNLENNQFLKNCHPGLVTIHHLSACVFHFERPENTFNRKPPFFICQKLFYLLCISPVCLLFLLRLIYDLCPPWVAPASLKLTPVALTECGFNRRAQHLGTLIDLKLTL